MKIRLYPIDGRQSLRDIQNPQWDQAFSKVITSSVDIPIEFYLLVFGRSKIPIRSANDQGSSGYKRLVTRCSCAI